MMTSKAHGYRWKFLIESFKEKVKTGEVYVAGTSTDEEAEREKQKNERELEHIRRRNMSRDTTAKRILRESVGEASGDIPPAVVDKDQDPFSGEDQGSDAELSVLQRSPTPKQRGKPSSTSEKGAAGLPLSEKPDSQKTPRPRIKFVGASSDEDSEEEQMQHAPKFLDKPVKIKSKAVFADESYAVRPLAPTVRFFQYKDEDEAEEREKEYGDQKPVIPVPAVVKIDKECWTHEPEYDKYLHVRIYKPVCKKAPTPFCSVAFHGQLLKTEVFEEEEEEPSTEKEESGSPALGSKTTSTKTEGKTKIDKQKSGKTWNGMNTNDKSTSRKGVARGANKRAASPTPASRPQSAVFEEDTKPSTFKEVKFKLPDDNGVTLGKPAADLTHEAFRLAVHPAKDRAMIAMATLNYWDLKIQDEVNEDFSSSDSTPSIQQFSLTSVVSDRDMPFNSTCGQISLFCYSSKIQRLTKHAKSTETIPFDDLVDATIEARRQEEMELQPNEVIQETPEPIYTEGDVMALKEQHAEEIQQLQEEYEKRLNELAQGLSPYPPELETSQDFVDAVTSPIIIKSPSLVRPESPGQTKTPKPPSNARTSPPRKQSRPRMPSLPEWGKDLPEDFLVRLNLFTENSSKYHQELGEKTRKVMQERYELQMAVQNRLAHSDDPETQGDTDVCLPAVFMPTRTSHVYSPKAHSYFHPPGSSESRLTQPPSIFKLPSVPSESQVSVLNLFEMSKKYRPTGPSWFTEDQARPHTIANPVQAQTASPPPTACDVWSPPPYQDRARTR